MSNRKERQRFRGRGDGNYQEYQCAFGDRTIAGLTPDIVLELIKKHELLDRYFKKNSEEKQRLILDRFIREPTSSDGPGFIYGYQEKDGYDHTANSYWIKIGRTSNYRSEHRILQWEKDDDHEINQIFTLCSEFNIKLEGLIHLIFNYAHELRTINGHQRIEWFNFQEKTLTLAVADIINFIMNALHGLHNPNSLSDSAIQLPLNSFQISKVYTLLIAALTSSASMSSIRKEDRVALIGLPSSGKTVVRHLMEGYLMRYRRLMARVYEIQVNPAQDDHLYLELNNYEQPEGKNFSEQETAAYMAQSFINWSKVLSSRSLQLAIVIKQADLESSCMLVIKTVLKMEQAYNSSQQSPVIFVSHCDSDFTLDNIGYLLSKNRQMLTQHEFDRLSDAEYLIVPNPEADAGEYIKEKLVLFKDAKAQLRTIKLVDSFAQDRDLEREYHQIVSHCFSRVVKIIDESFQRALSQKSRFSIKYEFQTKEEEQMLLWLRKLLACAKSITLPSEDFSVFDPRLLYTELLRLSELLGLREELQVELLVYCFSSCVLNSNMFNSHLCKNLCVSINKQMHSINERVNSYLELQVKIFRNSLEMYLRTKLNEVLSICCLERVLAIDRNSVLQDYFIELANQWRRTTCRKDKLACDFMQVVESITNIIEGITTYERHGCRVNSFVGRIRQAVLTSLQIAKANQQQGLSNGNLELDDQSDNEVQAEKTRTHYEQTDKPNPGPASSENTKILPSQKEKTPERKPIIQKQLHNEKTQESKGHSEVYNLIANYKLNEGNQIELSPKLPNCRIFRASNYSSLVAQLPHEKQTYTIVNIPPAGEFLFDVPFLYIRHSLVIMARDITVQSFTQCQFKCPYGERSGVKSQRQCLFLLMCNNMNGLATIANVDYKMKLSKSSSYGKMCAVTTDGMRLFPFDSYFKYNKTELSTSGIFDWLQVYRQFYEIGQA